MSEAFVAFVRFEEKLLLLKRSEQSEYFSGLWDGVWGVGATPEEVLLLEFLWNLFTIRAQDLSVELTWDAPSSM